ncbi:MAG: hypothetical protein ACFFDW_01075 [Candidatus Thorarchaeota archaeon]
MPIAKQVMILSKEGLLLLDHKFRGGEGLPMATDPDLFSGMLSAILSVAKETTGGLVKTINQDNYNVIVGEGEKVYALLFIDEGSRELYNIAKMIVGRFEAKFREQILDIIPDISMYKSFIEDLEEIYAEIFKIDAELLSKLISEVSTIMNVSIYEKPMNHQVYSGPRDAFVSENDSFIQDLALATIESLSLFSEQTLEFHKRSILEFKSRTIIFEDLGTHILMITGEDQDDILNKIKRIRRKAGIPTSH